MRFDFGEETKEPEMDDDQLKHFSHEHPLAFKEEAPPKNEASGQPVLCSACGEPVLGSYYSCNQCSNEFILHKPCAQLGREIQHPMHEHTLTILTKDSRPYRSYICDMCGAASRAESYSCYECEFDLDFKCAADRDCIKHFSHKHLLKFIEKPHDDGSPVFCIGCLEPVLGPCYTCKLSLEMERNRSCSLFLHKSCAELRREIQHPMHHQHALTLNLNAAREYYCVACDQECSRKFSYSCFKCDFNLDPKCASEEGYKHFSHEHPLMFKKQGTTKRESDHLVICDACQVPVFGPSYTCININRRRRCSFNLHKSCADLRLEIQHPVHRQHRLSLLNTIENIKVRCFCNACNQPCRYRYSCTICDFNLDLKCASNWQNIIDNDSHQHQFIVPRKELAELHLNCDVCGEYWSGVMIYICSICQLLVHEECASVPHYTNIPGHQHGLKLTWFLEDIYPKDQVCNICSTNINNCRTVYYCQECGSYVAHTTCIFLKEETQSRTIIIDDDYDSDDD
uniref:uncharacterized protein LOC105353270 n=1 Tax=Fragaria vesca subsp. vesca TaxID=101020 RepID=UPI0005C96017